MSFKISVMLFTINTLMLNLPVYLYTPAIRVFIDLDNFTNLGVDDMYHGYATIAKGIKNTIRFNFVNGEQRSINVQDKTFKFKLFDQVTNTQVLEKSLVVLDDTTTKSISTAQTAVGTTLTFADTTGIIVGQSVSGTGIQKNTTVVSTTSTSIVISSTTTSIAPIGTVLTFVTRYLKGATELQLVTADTENINAGRYVYSVVRVESDNELSPVFIDGASSMNGNVMVTDGVLPSYRPSDELPFLKITNTPEKWSTGKISANRDGRGNNALHTAQFYYTNFTGTVKVYGSLLNSIEGDNGNWVELTTTDYAGQTTTNSINLTGVENFNYFKFEYLPVSGSVDKVLYRS